MLAGGANRRARADAKQAGAEPELARGEPLAQHADRVCGFNCSAAGLQQGMAYSTGCVGRLVEPCMQLAATSACAQACSDTAEACSVHMRAWEANDSLLAAGVCVKNTNTHRSHKHGWGKFRFCLAHHWAQLREKSELPPFADSSAAGELHAAWPGAPACDPRGLHERERERESSGPRTGCKGYAPDHRGLWCW